MKNYVSSEDFIDIAVTIPCKNMFQYLQIGKKKKKRQWLFQKIKTYF